MQRIYFTWTAWFLWFSCNLSTQAELRGYVNTFVFIMELYHLCYINITIYSFTSQIQPVNGAVHFYWSIIKSSVFKLNKEEFHDELVHMLTNKNVLWDVVFLGKRDGCGASYMT